MIGKGKHKLSATDSENKFDHQINIVCRKSLIMKS